MASSLPGFEYDIFISYRHNDNRSGWVNEFVKALQEELAATIKEPVSVYFDSNPHDGLLETHNVDKSLEGKLKCLVFIPILSQTYCDPKSFAWQHEFVAFNSLAKEDQFGLDIKLKNGNVASRILPVRIHDLDLGDQAIVENEIGGSLRAVDFIYKEQGVNRPLKPSDIKSENQIKTDYRNQINKLANAIKEILLSIQHPKTPQKSVVSSSTKEPLTKSIAVLPFVNMSNEPEQEFFSDGLSEELLHLLSNQPGLRVAARTSSFSFKKKNDDIHSIGQKLNVQFILEGSVRKAGNTIRVTTLLSNAEDGVLFSSAQYDRQLENVIKLQEDIAGHVVKELKISLNVDRSRSNPVNNEAYLLTLHGNYLMSLLNEESFQKALSNFKKAAKLDPSYAPAFSGLALAYLELGGWHSSASMEYIHEAIKHASHAVELDEQFADSYIVLGRIHFYQFDWSKAEANFRKAIQLKPSATAYRVLYANFLTAMGRFQESIRFGIQTIELDPLSGVAYSECGWTYFHSRQDEKALACIEKGLELESHYPIGLLSMGWLMAEIKRPEEAIPYTDRAYQIISGVPTLSILAATNYALAGFKGKALDIHGRLLHENKLQQASSFSLAMLWLALGNKDLALEDLQKAYQRRDILLVWLKTFRIFDSIRSDQRFMEVYAKMKFAD